MKCPQCGRWNRATLDQCFYCGAALPAQQQEPYARDDTREMPQPSASVIYSVNDDGETTTPRPDDKDKLAKEMQSFHVRRKRGELQQERIRLESAESGFAPEMFGSIQGTRTTRIYSETGVSDLPRLSPEGETRQDAMPAPAFNRRFGESEAEEEELPSYEPLWNDNYRAKPRNYGMAKRSMRHVRIFGLRRYLPYLALLLMIAGLATGGYLLVDRWLEARRNAVPDAQVTIISTIQDDMAAHTVRIPAEEGAQIYIKELRKSYIVAGGYAEITVPDYTWYELAGTVETPTMEVTLTPYIKTSAGEQKLMDTVSYVIDIPESPLLLITPDTNWLEVSTSPVQIQFQVAQNSTVFINGEDYSSFVNTNNGIISYNATVLARGENTFDIVVNCQYYRQHSERITLYRAPQDIPLELAATLGNTSSSATMSIKGTTIPGATITVTSPYENLDTSSLNSTGDFSFTAKFSTIGNNDITIIAQRDGLSTTLVKTVYYVPYSSEYTPKAWPMYSGYLDYLNNLSTRVARTQIYECVGTITEILSSKPQLALMSLENPYGSTGSTERLVLLENRSGDTWEVGERYRVYADAYGVYDGKPRLTARYTYRPREQ